MSTIELQKCSRPVADTLCTTGTQQTAQFDLKAALCAHPGWVSAAWARMAGDPYSGQEKPSGYLGASQNQGPLDR